jgi:hypothetical protein
MNYAIIENDTIVNVIVAESLQNAQAVLQDNQEVLEMSDDYLAIGFQKYNNRFLPPKPNYECVWHEETFNWRTQEEIDLYNEISSITLQTEITP